MTSIVVTTRSAAMKVYSGTVITLGEQERELMAMLSPLARYSGRNR